MSSQGAGTAAVGGVSLLLGHRRRRGQVSWQLWREKSQVIVRHVRWLIIVIALALQVWYRPQL